MLRRSLLKLSAIPGAAYLAPKAIAAATPAAAGVSVWLETSLKRVFPNTPRSSKTELQVLSARNQRVSFQACVRNETIKRVKVECAVSGGSDLKVETRRVGYVPLPHHSTDV